MQDTRRARAIVLELARSPGTHNPDEHRAALLGELATSLGHAAPAGGKWPLSTGTLDVRVAVLVLPAADVRRLLPDGLELAPQPIVPSDWHPVLLLSSRNVFHHLLGTDDYEGLTIAVPYAQISDVHAPYPGPFIYVRRLFVNEREPAWVGAHIHAWETQDATIRVHRPGGAADPQTDFVVVPEGATTPAVTACFTEVPGTVAGPTDAVANFAIARLLLEQPRIAQALHVVDAASFDSRLPGLFLATNVVIHADLPGATLTPITASITISAALGLPGIPTGTHDFPSLQDDPLGAFRLQCTQTVSLPGPVDAARYPRPPGARKLRVAVLGGGPAACAAALYLARQKDRFEVSVYTTGYRLGGKCQSWRNPAKADRIEEHGLHAFLGFYRNAFTAVKDAYHDAYEDPRHGAALYVTAFKSEPNNGLMVHRNQEWTYCATPKVSSSAPPPPGAPGPQGHPLVLALVALLQRIGDDSRHMRGHTEQLDGLLDTHDQTIDRVRGQLMELADTDARAPTSPLERVESDLVDDVKKIHDELAEHVREVDGSLRTYLWFLWTGINTMWTILRGLREDRVRNLSELDGEDFRVWLRGHGLKEPDGESWQVIDQVYETLFAHQNDDRLKDACKHLETDVRPANLAAGVGVRWYLLEAAGTFGTASYRFEYSCAQTIMTPFYLALERLGAAVNFFHVVDGLELTGVGPHRRLTRVKLTRQAEVKAGASRYQPLFIPDRRGNPPDLHDWPMDPHHDQLVDGEWFKANNFDFFDSWQAPRNIKAKPVTLEYGRDYDLCVLGIPLGALPMIDSPLTSPNHPDPDPRWKRMIDGINVTQTMSFQLWLEKPAAQMIAGTPRGLLTTYAQPQPSYGDFTSLLAHEAWTTAKPRLVAYFTGASVAGKPPLPPACGPDFPANMQRDWQDKVVGWLRNNYAAFFDGPGAPGTFEEFLAILAVENFTGTDVARLLWQHIIADVEPSNLYVLSQQDSTQLRLGQADSGVASLILCGDWTRTELNCGCVEAAITSGMLAARAISDEPRSIQYIGF